MQPRVAIGIVIIVGLVGWLSWSGFQDGSAYYLTCDEVAAMGAKATAEPIRLAGNVVEGSIEQRDGQLHFALEYNGARYPVVYVGDDPVPDTFKDGAEAVVDGQLGADGQFAGRKIQAKCASKYEAEYDNGDAADKGPARTA